jgi:hypothetical protein
MNILLTLLELSLIKQGLKIPAISNSKELFLEKFCFFIKKLSEFYFQSVKLKTQSVKFTFNYRLS